MDRFWAKVQKTESCWLWTGARARVGWHGTFHDGKRVGLAHRFIWERTHGPIPAGMLVCHHCDVPNCVNPFYLYEAATTENMADCSRRGRTTARLSAHEIACIREALRHRKRGTVVALARQYGVSHAVICGIADGTKHRHV